jgi:predicted nucleic acid-binding protein
MVEPSEDLPPRVVPDPGTVGVAVYDATCLFSKHGRYLLLGLAVHGVVLARWSRRLLEETAANLAGQLRGDSLEDLGRWLKTEADLVRDGLVEGYDRWLDHVELPDPDDRHVLAAAIECGATTIVTGNRRDFPDDRLDPIGITAVEPDEFGLACIDASPVAAARIVTDHPKPMEFLERLAATLPRTARCLSDLTT